MSGKGLFLQNVIAIIWDFDKTLSPDYMQKPIFDAYGVDEDAFWAEVNALPGYYGRAGIEVQRDTCYLGHLLSYVRHGIMKDLTNKKLQKLGDSIEFFPGLPGFFDELKEVLDKKKFREGDLRLEHYIVSTGLDAMIRGSAIFPKVDGVWASVFIEEPAAPKTDLSGLPASGPISQIAGFLDNTTKTRALFEINKGVNKKELEMSVNDSIPEEQRRVPFKNMIYVADGPSDIPSFSLVKEHGGHTYAVYTAASNEDYDEAHKLVESGRVDHCGEADYRPDKPASRWLTRQVRMVAERMMEDRKRATQSSVTPGPTY